MNYYAMKAYGEVDAKIDLFLISVLFLSVQLQASATLLPGKDIPKII
jgi:hypothetical protein